MNGEQEVMRTHDSDVPDKARDIAENIHDKVDKIAPFLAFVRQRRLGAGADVTNALDDTIAGLEATLFRSRNALAALAGKPLHTSTERARPIEHWMMAMIRPTEINIQLMDYWIASLVDMKRLYDNPPVPLLEGEDYDEIRRRHRTWIEHELRANSVARERAAAALAALKG